MHLPRYIAQETSCTHRNPPPVPLLPPPPPTHTHPQAPMLHVLAVLDCAETVYALVLLRYANLNRLLLADD